MIYLLFSVLASSSLLIFFKLYSKYKVNTTQAIAFNYVTAAFTALFFVDNINQIGLNNDFNWIYAAGGLGFLFFLVFTISSISTQKVSLGITSIAMKLGLLFPIILGIVIYNEQFKFVNYVGLGLGIISLYFLTFTPNTSISTTKSKWIIVLPILVWLGSGICDSTVQMANKLFPIPSNNGAFALLAFTGASISGLIYIFLIKRQTVEIKSIIGGICLGIPNYFSIYFLFKCLNSLQLSYNLSTALIFTINNISIVLVSLFIGILFFKETLHKFNYIGIIIALISIVFISI